MKKLFLVTMLLLSCLSFTAMADETKAAPSFKECKVEYLYRGTFYNTCPMDTVMTGVRINHPQGPFIPNAWVTCAEPVVWCENDKQNDNRTE